MYASSLPFPSPTRTLPPSPSGVFYGSNFDPPQYLIDNCGCASLTDRSGNQPSTQVLDYVFSHFTGIFLSSIFYFMLYAILSKNKPMIYPKAILPAFVSGLMWSVAQVRFKLNLDRRACLCAIGETYACV